ncbi:hypothetical protein SEVIR_7G297034v4 [Setaria viridis]
MAPFLPNIESQLLRCNSKQPSGPSSSSSSSSSVSIALWWSPLLASRGLLASPSPDPDQTSCGRGRSHPASPQIQIIPQQDRSARTCKLQKRILHTVAHKLKASKFQWPLGTPSLKVHQQPDKLKAILVLLFW